MSQTIYQIDQGKVSGERRGTLSQDRNSLQTDHTFAFRFQRDAKDSNLMNLYGRKRTGWKRKARLERVNSSVKENDFEAVGTGKTKDLELVGHVKWQKSLRQKRTGFSNF